jgi:hypothetical protein
MNQALPPRTAIFIKSFPGDYQWLTHCLRSIRKFCTGHHEVVLAIPEDAPFQVENERVVFANCWNETTKGPHQPTAGYWHQMYVKLCADLHCPDAEVILYLDSDCVFKWPFDVSEMFVDGKPKLLRRSWEEAGGGIHWREPAEHALGVPCKYDTMATHPSVYWSDTVRATREAIEKRHNQKLQYYIRSRKQFIEFVTLGNYALQHEPERYHVVECGPDDGYPRPLQQFWSHGGFGDSDAKVIEDMLK